MELSLFRDKPEDSLFSFKNCPNSGIVSPLLKEYSIDAAYCQQKTVQKAAKYERIFGIIEKMIDG